MRRMVDHSNLGPRNTNVLEVTQNARRYVRAADFLHRLYKLRGVIPFSEIQRLRAVAIGGDVTGAEKGLEKLIRRYEG